MIFYPFAFAYESLRETEYEKRKREEWDERMRKSIIEAKQREREIAYKKRLEVQRVEDEKRLIEQREHLIRNNKCSYRYPYKLTFPLKQVQNRFDEPPAYNEKN
jgi:hypothetical protein